MIYWIEHAPNPWVRAIAIAIIGGVAYFEYTSGANLGPWLGGYGACNDDPYDGTTPEIRAGADAEGELRALSRAVGPVTAAIALRALRPGLTEAEVLDLHRKVWPAPKKGGK